MTEHVFRPSRTVNGKRVRGRLYCGRYTIEAGERPTQVALNTPDKQIALKRLREIVVEKQREREGILAPKAVRETASAELPSLVNEYEANLTGLGRRAKHVHDTVKRLRRMIEEIGWHRLADVRSDQFTQWRSFLSASAKTKKEYQVSINAFLNWLVRNDRLQFNPLAKLETVETRGKEVRKNRAFSDDELRRLFAVAGKRKLAYQTLLYTGQRKSEARALVWGDLHLEDERPYALFREGTTKDKDKRAVPLHPQLVSELRKAKPENVSSTKKVFWFCWPTYDHLRADMDRAGIERKDGLGRVLHFHSFRKTWQTMGVRFGVNQRAAQEVLGHSDANLTAKAYTDVPALSLHTEINKFPWISDEAEEPVKPAHSLIDSLKSGVSRNSVSFADTLRQLADVIQLPNGEELSHFLSLLGASGASGKMAARAGVEPAYGVLQAAAKYLSYECGNSTDPQIDSLDLDRLTKIVGIWASLSPAIRAAVWAVVVSEAREGSR